jgi:hypothetical protein
MQEVFNWIVKIIETCNNDFHFEGIDKLIDLFYDKYKNDALTDELKLIRIRTWNKIHNIL